jgi:CRISPR-associated protein Csb1
MTIQRTFIDVPLEPIIGSRFQPTGFPDLGAAEFQRPDGTSCLIVESAQSMANRLEGTAWDDAENQPVDVFEGLPYIRVNNVNGEYLTSSRTDAHRLASAYVREAQFNGAEVSDLIRDRMGLRASVPHDHRQIARALFAIDPFTLIHGVFFAIKKWPGQPKVARALTSFIEAIDVRRADSGGVKRDHVSHSNENTGGSSEGYGSVPFARTEWTADTIMASFAIDHRQIRSYGLGEAASQLLVDIARWEIRCLLDDGLRLRTSCDLVPKGLPTSGSGWADLPSLDELSQAVRGGITACAPLLEGAAVLEVVWNKGKSSKESPT